MKKSISILFILFVSIFNVLSQGTITIDSPSNNDPVDQYSNRIEFTVSGNLINSTPVVFIKDPNDDWWVNKRCIRIPNRNNKWELTGIQFGEAVDKGQSFTIQIAMINTAFFNSPGFSFEGRNIVVTHGNKLRPEPFVFLKGLHPNFFSNEVYVKRRN